MPTESLFLNGNTSYADVIDLAETHHLDNSAVNQLIWGILDQNRTRTRRTFTYGADFAAAEPECAPQFARSFAHIDWIDGESVVQAEETSLEDGFNLRFHRIEDDFDRLAADVTRLFNCLAELRGELSARLAEIKTAINLINGDIAECCDDERPPWQPWPIDPGIFEIDPYPYPGGWTYPGGGGGGWVRPGGGYINPGSGGGFGLNPGLGGTLGPYGPRVNPAWGLERYAHRPGASVKPWMPQNSDPIEFDARNIVRSSSDPDRAIVAGLPGQRLTTDTFNGKLVDVWSTPSGIVMTPGEKGAAKTATGGWLNPHITAAQELASWAATNQERVAQQLGDSFTVQQFDEKFGTERLGSGTEIGAFLKQLPSGLTVRSGAEIAALGVDRATANIKRDRTVDESLIGLVGLSTATAEPGRAEVGAMRSIPAKVGTAMAAAGVTTVAELAKIDGAKLQAGLRRQNVSVSLEQAVGWGVEANVLAGLMKP